MESFLSQTEATDFTEKGLGHFLTALKTFVTQKEFHHCLTNLKVFNIEKRTPSLSYNF